MVVGEWNWNWNGLKFEKSGKWDADTRKRLIEFSVVAYKLQYLLYHKIF